MSVKGKRGGCIDFELRLVHNAPYSSDPLTLYHIEDKEITKPRESKMETEGVLSMLVCSLIEVKTSDKPRVPLDIDCKHQVKD